MLKTKRLILRAWCESDADNLFKYAKDPEVGYPAGWPKHQSVEESRDIIEKHLNGRECYAICLKEDNKAIGAIELKLNGSTDLTDQDNECELGYWIGKEFWGKGYVPEAANELIRYGFEDLSMEKIWCGYYDGNEKSKRVQEKCGFKFYRTTEGIEVTRLNEIRTGHTSVLTKQDWLRRYFS